MKSACIAFAILASFLVRCGGLPPQTQSHPETADASTVDRLHLCIDAYIFKNGFNQYGDPQGTWYRYGTPLMDETTGEIMDKYWYVCELHYVHVNACKACGWEYATATPPPQ